MKKILLLGLALSLFSCSSDDQTVNGNERTKDIQTLDTTIGYASPYKYGVGHGLHIGGSFTYQMINMSDLTFEITPFFGLGAYDGDALSDVYWENLFGGAYKVMDPSSEYYAPNLTANGFKYGNYVSSETMKLLGNTSKTMTTHPDYPVYVDHAGSTIDGFNFNYPGSTFQTGDAYFLQKSGKLFFIKFTISDSTNPSIASSSVKMSFPHNANINGAADWDFVGLNDSYFGEPLVYNHTTREICLVITNGSTYKDKYRFTYQNNEYEVGTRSVLNSVVIYLRRLN